VVNIISSSLSSATAIRNGRVLLLPIEPTTLGYQFILRSPMVISGFLNSIIYTVAGTSLNVFMTILAAYPLSRKDLVARGPITFFFVLTMFIGGGIIPTYLLISKLGMINTRFALIIPGALAVWFVIIARTYLSINIPDELHQAAEMDGCSEFRFVWSIVLPLSRPVIAFLVLMYAVGHWNSYFSALMYIHRPELQPLQIVLRNILLLSQVTADMNADAAAEYMAKEEARAFSYLLKYSLIIVASVPVMVLYPFIQKHFVKGVMIGSLKG
jgi:ABC-type glycerol-3-phosphate transport system permease component